MTGHGRVGLIDPEATKDFANRLAILLSDPEQRKLMTSWALNEVKKYDYPKIVNQYEAAYREAIRLKTAEKNGTKNEKKRKIIHRIFIRRHAR
jgi:glycosyltransferase involved in cell wall biosynthesis